MKLFLVAFILPLYVCAQEAVSDTVKRDTVKTVMQKNVPPYDTIWVPMTPREVKITVDKGGDTPNEATIGSKEFGSKILGCCIVILKAGTPQAEPASLFILHGDKIYNGVIAYKEGLSKKDEIIDWRSAKEKPKEETVSGSVKEEIRSNAKIDNHMGMLEGKSKDKYNQIASVNAKDRISMKLSDIMQDETHLYVKVWFINESKINYEIDLVDFLFRNTADQREYKQIQEGEKVHNGVTAIEAKKAKVIVYAFPKFTITTKWELSVTMREKNGGRKIELVIPADKIIEAAKF
jgi:hypothetical protein